MGMSRNKTKLELTWIGKDKRPRLEPRILLEDPELSYSAAHKVTENDVFDNMVIRGDNLLALKALEQEYLGKVKCIYIDPPYNTLSADLTYDDNVEHSIWLSLMRARLEILWRLLTSENGVLLISINDDECHYLKVLCDELFGRSSFVACLVWNYEGNTDNQARIINYHEYVLVYSRTGVVDDPSVIDPNIPDSSKLFKPDIRNTVIKNGPKNPVKAVTLPAGFPASFRQGVIRRDDVVYPKYDRDIEVDDGRTIHAVTGRTGWSSRSILQRFIDAGCAPVLDSKGQTTVFELTPTGAIEAVKKRGQKKGHFISVLRGFGTTNQMRLMLAKLGLKFSYPKPVGLISYLIDAFTGPNDLVLDSFAGSGTTGHAVLNLNLEKQSQRRFILVELDASTCFEVLIPRLRAVLDGNAAADIPPHGGGFRVYQLAPSLLETDKWGNWIINRDYNKEMLAQAMCKIEGFRYDPSPTVFWLHGQSTETDYIYVTTQTLTHEQLRVIDSEVGEGRTLLICCSAFRARLDQFPNLTVKKIPATVLASCEWGRDDYSLNVQSVMGEELEEPEPEKPADSEAAASPKKKHTGRTPKMQDLPLFAAVSKEGDQ